MLATILTKLPLLFAVAPGHCEKSFFGLVPWYHYLDLNDKCEVVNFQVLGAKSDLLLVLLAVVDNLLRIAGIVAVVFIIYGGIQYITSQGESDKASKAQNTIVNALVGLVIALIAIALVSFLGNRIG
jgi:hypothetical protein